MSHPTGLEPEEVNPNLDDEALIQEFTDPIHPVIQFMAGGWKDELKAPDEKLEDVKEDIY